MPRLPKSRPSTPFNGANCVRYDNGYIRNKVVFTVLGGRDLWIQLCSGRAPKKTALDFYIDCFKSYTAVEVIRDINSFNATRSVLTFGGWGRHFEDGVLEVWSGLNLPLGDVKPITRSV
jgi:hypothetical protein